MHKKIEDYLKQATEGLRDDSELQLDTRAELLSHAECKLEELQAEGVNDEEAIEQTIASLGDPLELATDLYSANLRRMKIRSWALAFMRFALIPLSIATLIWGFDPSFMQSIWQGQINSNWTKMPSPSVTENAGLTDEERFLFHGDPQATSELERRRSIWESDPENPTYFGSYFEQLLSESNNEFSTIPADLIATGIQLEPDNALYRYVDALREIQQANAIQVLDPWELPSADEAASIPAYEILDREAFDKAMHTVLGALDLQLNIYHEMDMTELQFEVLPPPVHIKEITPRVQWVFSRNISVDFGYRELLQYLTIYADLQLQEGLTKQAQDCLLAHQRFAEQCLQDNRAVLISIIFARAALERGFWSAAVLDSHGHETEAAQLRRFLNDSCAQMKHEWEAFSLHNSPSAEATKYASNMTLAILPENLCEYKQASDYTPLRRLEYAGFTELTICFTNGIAAVMLTLCLLGTLRYRFSRRATAPPLLLMPTEATLINTILLGIVAPCVAFIFITRVLPISGHEYSTQLDNHRLLLEHGLLPLWLLVWPVYLGIKAVRKRCAELIIQTQSVGEKGLFYLLISVTALALLIWLIPIQKPFRLSEPILFAATAVFLICVIWAALIYLRGLFAKPHFRLYYGTLFRSLAPLFALIMLLLAAMSRPYFSSIQKQYIQADPHMMKFLTTGVPSSAPQLLNLRQDMLNKLNAFDLEVHKSE